MSLTQYSSCNPQCKENSKWRNSFTSRLHLGRCWGARGQYFSPHSWTKRSKKTVGVDGTDFDWGMRSHNLHRLRTSILCRQMQRSLLIGVLQVDICGAVKGQEDGYPQESVFKCHILRSMLMGVLQVDICGWVNGHEGGHLQVSILQCHMQRSLLNGLISVNVFTVNFEWCNRDRSTIPLTRVDHITKSWPRSWVKTVLL